MRVELGRGAFLRHRFKSFLKLGYGSKQQTSLLLDRSGSKVALRACGQQILTRFCGEPLWSIHWARAGDRNDLLTQDCLSIRSGDL